MMTPLRKARIDRGMTLEEAADALNLSVSQLSRIERGAGTTTENAERIARFFGISEIQILFPHRFMGQPEETAA